MSYCEISESSAPPLVLWTQYEQFSQSESGWLDVESGHGVREFFKERKLESSKQGLDCHSSIVGQLP